MAPVNRGIVETVNSVWVDIHLLVRLRNVRLITFLGATKHSLKIKQNLNI